MAYTSTVDFRNLWVSLLGMSLISILLPVRNGADCLELTVRYLQAQTLPDFEVLVMDDGSEDLTWEILQNLAASDSRIRVFRHLDSQGITRSLNNLIAHATGKYVARQDCGDYSFPQRLEVQYNALEANPEAVLCVSSFWLLDEEEHPLGIQRIPLDGEALKVALQQANPVCHSTFFLPTAAIRKINGYSADALHTEDYDLLFRLGAHGPFVTVAEPLVAYVLNPRGISFRNLRTQMAQAALLRHKHLGSPPPSRTQFPPLVAARARARYDARVGRIHLAKLRLSLARHHLFQAWKVEPRSVGNLFWLFASLLPRGFWSVVKSARSHGRPVHSQPPPPLPFHPANR